MDAEYQFPFPQEHRIVVTGIKSDHENKFFFFFSL
jgi:hypothetical protein